MKHILKRSFALLLVLAMVASLFAGLTITASAAQPTSAGEVNYVKSGSYVYNWGKRDTVATFLTTYANSYYTGDYTYEKLSALSGNSGTGTAFYSSAMGTAIHNMLVAKQKSTTGYSATNGLYQYTDCQESGGKISSYYSATPIGPAWDSGSTWNKEHTWPNSKGLDGSDENDIMMLRPTAKSENSSRGNTAYGENGSYYNPNSNGQKLHGDVARLMLQHLMRWGNTSYFYGSSGVMESRAVLLKWMEEDPVDTWEMGRNDAVQQITGVRNVFVDYPELGFLLLGAEIPANYQTPSGIGAGSQYTITATSNNTSYGTVSVSGRIITASPKTGYYAKDYTVTSGTATVTQNGNIFTVNAESDCTVRINFAAKTSATVSFSVPVGVTCNPIAGYAGDAIQLPTPTGTPTGDYTYTFKGWVRSAVDNQTGKPAEILSAGADFTPTGNTTLYALYSYSVGGTGGSSTTFTKITAESALTDGASYVLTSSATGKALSQDVASNWAKAGGTYSGNSIESPAATDVWTVSSGVISCSKGNLYSSAAKSISLSSSKTTWTFTVSGGAWTIKSGNNVLSFNSSGWRPYSGGYGEDKTFYIYKSGAGGGTTYYTTVIGAPCDHTYTSVVTAPNCTEGGYTTHTCSECGYNYKDTYTDPLGHAYGTAVSNGNGTHTKTCSRCTDKVTENCDYDISVVDYVTTYTCKLCGAVYTSEATVYTVTYSVLGTVTGSDTCEEGKTVTLPTTATAVDGYEFKGWVASAIGTETDKAPTVLTSSYKPTDNITLYAVYTRTEAGQGGSSDTYALTDDLANGDYMFGATHSGGVVVPNTTVTSGWLKYKSFTPSNGVITNTDALYVWTLTNQTGGGFTLKNKSTGSYLYIKSSTGSGTATTDSNAHTVYATVAVEGDKSFELHDSSTATTSTGNQLCFNYNGGSGGYRNYANRATETNMPNQFTFYKAGAGMITYYTTQPTGITPCAHPETTLTGAVEATCTADGYTGDEVCNECHAVVTSGSVIHALGHDYGAFTSNGNGTHSKTCSRCTDKVTEDCSYSETTSGATVTHTCDVCGYSYDTQLGTYTVTLNIRGTETTLSCIEGESVELPTAAAVDGYTFAGWVTSAIAEETTARPTVIPAGSYTPDADITLYAVYTRTEEGAGPGNRFDLVTAATDITDGSYVLIIRANKDSKYYAIKQQADDSYVAAAAADSYMGTTVPTAIEVSDSSVIWALAGTSASFTLKNADGTCWLYNSSNKLYYNTTNSAVKFKATLRSDNTTFTVAAGSAYMGLRSDLAVGTNGLYRFRCNSSASTSDYYFYLYKNAGGTGDVIHYTTNPTAPVPPCTHSGMQPIDAKAETCTEDGNNAYFYCPDCEKYFTDASGSIETTVAEQTIPQLGHVLSEETTPATCTAAGETVTSCSRCDYSVSTPIAPLGHNYDSGVITTYPTATAEGVMTYTCTRPGCGDSYTEPIPALGDKIPYTRAVEITSGKDYIMAFHYTYDGADKWYGIGAVSSKQCAIYEIPAPVSNIVSLDKNVAYLWTLAADEDTDNGYTIFGGGKYLTGSSDSTDLSARNTPVTWIADTSKSAEGTFWFKIGTRGIGLQSGSSVKNYAVSNATNTGTNYTFDIYLFANTCAHANPSLQGYVAANCANGTNGYSGDLVCLDCGAVLEPGHTISSAHVYEVDHTDPATCEQPGTAYEVCSGCGKTRETPIAALGHDYQQTAHADATCTEDGYTTYTCTHDASHTYTDTVPALGHHYDPETGLCSGCGDQLATYTVSFTVPNGINAIDPITAFDTFKITLPEPTGTLAADAEDYRFAGWVTEDVDDGTDTEFVEAGEYTVSGDVTFKALYYWVGEGSFGGEDVYKLLTEDDLSSLDTGWTLIIANDGKWQSKTMALADYPSGDTESEKFAGKTVTVSNNTITLSATSDVQRFTVVKDAESGYFYLITDAYVGEKDAPCYLTACSSSSNAIDLTDKPNANALWSISYHDDGAVKLTAQGNWERNTVLFNSSNYNGFFSGYGETYYGNAPSNIYGIRLFASNPIFHFTTAPIQHCDHETVTWTDNEDGTCTGVCDDCGHTVADHQTHAWTLDEDAEGTVAATCTADGKAGYVCSNCGAAELRDTEKLGHDYVGVETTAPTCSAAGTMTYTCSRCPDSYEEPIPATPHSFEDGECTVCHTSLYVLVTEAPENWEGEYLIVYVDSDNAKVFDGKNDAAANYTVGTFYGEEGSESSLICVADPSDYAVMFDPYDGGYHIMNADADWWSYTQAKNGFSVSTSTSFAAKYSISLDASGNAIIKNAGNYSIKFNTQADEFRFYGTSITTTVKLYEKYGTCHHNWVPDEDASTPASCGVAGNNVYECSACHEIKNETVPALQHDYYYNEVPATCTEEGYTECYCHNCDYAEILDYSITEPLGHDFSRIVEDEDHYIAPSCTEEGLAVYQCSRCDEFDTEATVLDPLGHDYVNGVCSRCGDELEAQTYTLMTSLDFGNAGSVIMVIKVEDEYYALTEEADGKYLVTKPVTVNGNTVTVYDEGDYAIMMPFTNVNDGENVGYGFETAERNYLHVNSKGVAFAYETANAALAITQAEVWTGEYDSNDNPKMKKVPNAWFLQGKATGKFISNYIDSYEDTELSVTDDSWFAAPIYFFASTYTKPIEPEPSTHNLYHFEGYPATCTEEGYAEYYMCLDGDCECAGKMYADPYCTILLTDITIAPLGHDWQWDGKVGEEGYHGVECSRCPATDLVECTMVNGTCTVCGYCEESQPEELAIDSASIVLDGNIDLTYAAEVPAGYTEPYMVITGPNGEQIIDVFETDENGKLLFTYDDVNPQCMGDNITATLYATNEDGEPEQVSKDNYSIRQNCVNLLKDDSIAPELRTLLSDMLAYGAAAQAYTNHNADNPVNVGEDIHDPTPSTFAGLTGLVPVFDGTAEEDIFWNSVGLTLSNSVAMNFTFYAESVEGLSVEVAINGRTETYTDFTAVGGKANTYRVNFTDITATEFGEDVTATFLRGGAQIGDSLTYSVNTYICAKQADSDPALAALVKALYNYGVSAKAYANKVS